MTEQIQSTGAESAGVNLPANSDFIALTGRVDNLDANEWKVNYWEAISGASGSVTKPTGATILLDQWSSGIDALLSTIVGGKPTGTAPLTAAGEIVTVTSFDASGAYTLSGVPSGYPMALIYVFKIAESNWDNVNLDYELGYENITTNLSSFGVDYDGLGGVITTGNYVEVKVPFTGTITDYALHSINPSTGAGLAGSIVIDIKRSNTSIIGSGNKPTLSSSASSNAAVSGWTSIAVAAGDILAFYVVSVTTCQKILCSIQITKS